MTKNQPRVLIVEDEAIQLRLLEATVTRSGYEVESVTDGQSAVDRILDASKAALDVVLLDNGLPNLTGIEVLERIVPLKPNLPIIMLTAQTSHKTIIDAMRAGARDFIVKPASPERIRTALDSVRENAPLVGDIGAIEVSDDTSVGVQALIGSSHAMQGAKRLAEKAARSLIPVLIEGESGVGKEVFARAIHQSSNRSNGPFIAVNCGAIPENLVESTLFGHMKGAFTGATETRKGKFLEADGGTLFLDEVGELPIDIQPKLLRALQERMIDAVGASRSTPVDIRVISATNRTLSNQVAIGQFREDLFYRLNVFPINLPPLRQRADDVPALTQHFLKQISEAEKISPKTIPLAVLDWLKQYPWPGNVRQLQNTLFRAMVLSESDSLSLDDFALGPVNTNSAAPETSLAPPQQTHDSPNTAPPGYGNANHGHAFEIPQPSTQSDFFAADGEIKKLEDVEAALIRAAIDHYKGRMSEVARRLGIGRSTLYRKIKDYGLEGIK